MRISELSRRSGVPVATIKFYLRERLLPEGRLTSSTQAEYDEAHVRRLALIRALTGPAGLSVAKARNVVELIDAPPPATHDLLGSAHAAVARQPVAAPDLNEVDAALNGLGWSLDPTSEELRAEVAAAVAAIEAAGFRMPEEAFDTYAGAMLEVATMELAHVPTDSPDSAVRYVVLGTVLVEPLLLALRRLAQHQASIRRYLPTGPAPDHAP